MSGELHTTETGNILSQPTVEEEQMPPKVKSHDSSVLDLAFAMDCTGSMGKFIHHAQQNIRKIVEEIVSSEKCDVHMALVEYRDHPPQDSTFVTRVQDFTPSIGKMKKALDNSSAAGGGDTPEAIADAFHQVLKLSWRQNSTKICVLVADAPPHGVNCSGDGFPNGCPELLDPVALVNDMAAEGITLYVVGCEPSIVPYKDVFVSFAYSTGGQYVPLTSASLLSKVIIGGAQEELSLAALMDEVQQEVDSEFMLATDGIVNEDEISAKVFSKLKKKGAKSKSLQSSAGALAPASKKAVTLSKANNLGELRQQFKPAAPVYQVDSVVADCIPFGFGGSGSGRRGGSRDSASMYGAASCRMGSAPPPPSATATDYLNVEQEVDYHQAKRMVVKSLAKCKKK